jgi:5-methylcytosine-specific restriction endonuclease McrA
VLGSVEWQKLRQRVIAASTICHICDRPLVPDAPPRSSWSTEVDHIVPLARFQHLGAETVWQMGLDPDNVAASHMTCNRRKGAKLGAAAKKLAEPRVPRGRSREWFGDGNDGSTRRTSRKW